MQLLIQNTWKYHGLFCSKQLVQNCLRYNFSSAASTTKNNQINNVKQSNKVKTDANQEEPIKEIKSKQIKIDRLNLTPHEYWITQGQGMERPFTGDKWFEKDVGYYHCIVCNSRLFTWDHKFQAPNGMASFWHHERNAVKIADNTSGVQESFVNLDHSPNKINYDQEKKRCYCSKCQSNLGLVFFDGPPPTFKRFSVNSAAVKFMKKEHWENPHFVTRKRKLKLSEEKETERKRAIYKAQQAEEKSLLTSSSSSSSSSSQSE